MVDRPCTSCAGNVVSRSAKKRERISFNDSSCPAMIAALHALRAKKPAKLVCAVPVASPDTLARIKPYADDVVCLEAPPNFFAVGQFYAEFPQISDQEVVEILRDFSLHRPS